MLYDFFVLDVNEYANIDGSFKINIFLFFLAVGICAAAVIITLYRSSLQRIVKQLTRLEAVDEERARTLGDLGLDRSIIIKMALSRDGGRLTRLIGRVGQKKYTYDEYKALTKQKGYRHDKIDFSSAEFYIREGKEEEAKNIVENYGASMYRTALYCVLVMALYVCLMFFMPEIIMFISGLKR